MANVTITEQLAAVATALDIVERGSSAFDRLYVQLKLAGVKQELRDPIKNMIAVGGVLDTLHEELSKLSVSLPRKRIRREQHQNNQGG